MTRKRIIRTLIEEIVVRVGDGAVSLTIRWVGGDHTALRVRKNRAGQHRWTTDADVVELVTVLARQMPDKAIASLHNRAGKTTARGNGSTARVCFFAQPPKDPALPRGRGPSEERSRLCRPPLSSR